MDVDAQSGLDYLTKEEYYYSKKGNDRDPSL